jgi:hypothetical protein
MASNCFLFFQLHIFRNFCHQKPDMDPDPNSVNPDPLHLNYVTYRTAFCTGILIRTFLNYSTRYRRYHLVQESILKSKNLTDRYRYRMVGRVWYPLSSVSDPNPHNFGKLDPVPHQSEKVEALEGHFGALEGPNPGESEW